MFNNQKVKYMYMYVSLFTRRHKILGTENGVLCSHEYCIIQVMSVFKMSQFLKKVKADRFSKNWL